MSTFQTVHSPVENTPPIAFDAGRLAELLVTPRLSLEPMTLAMVEAVLAGDRRRLQNLIDARLPTAWPGEQLVHQGFGCSLCDMRADPAKHLWGCRLMIARDGDCATGDRRLLGSVVFHGRPAVELGEHIADVGYGVEEASRGLGYATEGTRECVRWALAQPGILAVRATTAPWHLPSLRVITKLAMRHTDVRDHELVGELWEFQLQRGEI